jgi:K(+)-stimulated pyrophosphate-energized sodium pump
MSLWFLILYYVVPPSFYGGVDQMVPTITTIMLSAAVGASTMALFGRVGGGIYTKAADVGADLVGKVEAGIPEDDPRNPATIADNVGDNVGDVAGMGADLYESYSASILATASLGVAFALTAGKSVAEQLTYVAAPVMLAGIGVLISIVGVFLVKTKEGATMKQLLHALERSIQFAGFLIAIAAFGLLYLLGMDNWVYLGIAVTTGILAGILIGRVTERYTSSEYGPTTRIIKSTETGPATVIISGLAVGMESVVWPIVIIVAATAVAFYVGGYDPAGATSTLGGLFAVGMAAVGMLSTLGLTLATDAYGPVADNAGGNAEMAGLPPHVRERTDQLDALGNTTAATGKGFAIGSAALTGLALVAAYMQTVQSSFIKAGIETLNGAIIPLKEMTMTDMVQHFNVTPLNPAFLFGLFIGSMTAFYFCSLTMSAVGRAAGAMVNEVRRQFREMPGIMTGEQKPDYAQCVDISTQSALREMRAPSILAMVVPIVVGVLFGVPGVLGLLVGGLGTGFALAIMMSNAGGAWDNAKKAIEAGAEGGKGSPAHEASVVGDTVGDPFKDTAGPSLNILIKLMSIVSVVLAALIASIGQGFGLIGLLGG